jgi:hypothetical protein
MGLWGYGVMGKGFEALLAEVEEVTRGGGDLQSPKPRNFMNNYFVKL